MNITERLQDLKDAVIPRKLGYVQVKNLENLPKSQKLATCYCPISHIPHPETYKELDTNDYAAFAIKSMKRNNPQFSGLIFDPLVGLESDIKKAMQMYANKYGLPIASQINSKIEVIEPVKTNTKNNTIVNKIRNTQQHT